VAADRRRGRCAFLVSGLDTGPVAELGFDKSRSRQLGSLAD